MINQIVAAFMLSEGLICGVIAYVMYRKKASKLGLCQKIFGEVISVNEHCGRGSEGSATKHPVIRYTAANGVVRTFESTFGRSNWKVKAGDRLEIFVSRNDPAEAEVVGLMPQWGLPIVLGFVSLSSIVGAPIVYFVLKL